MQNNLLYFSSVIWVLHDSAYMPYLMYGFAAVAAGLLTISRICARSMPGVRGTGFLSWSYGLTLAVAGLAGMWPNGPMWLTVLVSSEAVFCSWLLLYCATAEILDRAASFLPWGVGIQHLALIALAYFTYIKPDLPVRIEIVCLQGALLAIVMAFLLFSEEGQEPEAALDAAPAINALTQMLGWLSLLISMQHIAHAFLTVLHPSTDFIRLDQIQTAFLYADMILDVVMGGGLLWLAAWMHRRGVYELPVRTAI